MYRIDQMVVSLRRTMHHPTPKMLHLRGRTHEARKVSVVVQFEFPRVEKLTQPMGKLSARQSWSRPNYLTCCVNTVQKVDVAQRVDELAFLYTNIRLRHQRNKTTVGRLVPSYLLTDYSGGLLGDCSQLLRFSEY